MVSQTTIILNEQTDPPTITLNCTVTNANPLPALTWMGPGGDLLGQQAVIRFMEVAMSTLTVNISTLTGGANEFTCTSTIEGGRSAQNSTNVTGYCKLFICLLIFLSQSLCIHIFLCLIYNISMQSMCVGDFWFLEHGKLIRTCTKLIHLPPPLSCSQAG